MRSITCGLILTCLAFCFAISANQHFARPDASQSGMAETGKHLHFLYSDSINFKTLLTSPPANDSVQTHDEIDWMLELQNTRTPAQIARAKMEVNLNPFLFSNVLGSWFNPDDLPLTTQLLRQAGADDAFFTDSAKGFYQRPRPYTLDSRLQPCVHRESSWSYPSGHTTHAIVWGVILSTMFPEQRDAIMARAYQIGDDRVLGGVHFPSDVAAGHVLGFAVAEALLANPQFQAQIQKARQECLADPKFSLAGH